MSQKPTDALAQSLTRKVIAYECTDERYTFIRGLVTTNKETIDAWREGGIAFVELVRRSADALRSRN